MQLHDFLLFYHAAPLNFSEPAQQLRNKLAA